jgi:hypothetical protein
MVIGVSEPRSVPVRFICDCDCGTTTKVIGSNLRRGNTMSCGCLGRENVTRSNTTHGHSRNYDKSRTYIVWSGMHRRVGKPGPYQSISVCDRWGVFEAFLADMGEVPEGRSIDRINTLGNYEPGNCRWATQREQQNNRTNNKLIEYSGECMTLAQWVAKLKLDYAPVHARLRLGWSPQEAFTIPVFNGRNNRAKPSPT